MFIRAAPVLLGAMIGAVTGLAAWSFWHSRSFDGRADLRTRDDVLLGFMFLTAVALASFLLYLLVILAGH